MIPHEVENFVFDYKTRQSSLLFGHAHWPISAQVIMSDRILVNRAATRTRRA